MDPSNFPGPIYPTGIFLMAYMKKHQKSTNSCRLIISYHSHGCVMRFNGSVVNPIFVLIQPQKSTKPTKTDSGWWISSLTDFRDDATWKMACRKEDFDKPPCFLSSGEPARYFGKGVFFCRYDPSRIMGSQVTRGNWRSPKKPCEKQIPNPSFLEGPSWFLGQWKKWPYNMGQGPQLAPISQRRRLKLTFALSLFPVRSCCWLGPGCERHGRGDVFSGVF